MSANLKRAADIEQQCREAFDNHFHKIAASMSYDQWRTAFKVGFRHGREDCMGDWADHMTRTAGAVAKATGAAGESGGNPV